MRAAVVHPHSAHRHHAKVIGVVDVVESVRMMEDDEAGFIPRWQRFVAHAHVQLDANGGRCRKSMGDGLMLEFDTPAGFVRTAFALQEYCRTEGRGLPVARRMRIRISAHLAAFIADEHDIYGADINLAVRVNGVAEPGETVVTQGVREALPTGFEAEVDDLGQRRLRHVREPVRTFRLRPAGTQGRAAAPSRLPRFDPRDDVYDLLAATAALATCRYAAAAELARDALASNPADSAGLRVLVVAEALQGREYEAAAALRRLVALDPSAAEDRPGAGLAPFLAAVRRRIVPSGFAPAAVG